MLTLSSPAKINLFLRIVNKRPDGYHNLSSLFQTIDLADTIHFQPYHQDLLTCSDSSLPLDEKNLILKATQLFRNKTGFSIYLKIHLEKNIPTEAGLGGGSSNAATTLWALNQISQLRIPDKELMQWGTEIGSDVAFFFSHGTAYCTGRGEKIQLVNPLPSSPFWIIKPIINLSTPAVYKQLHAPLKENGYNDLDDFLKGKMAHFNDLENPAFIIRPELFQLKQQLIACGFETVLLSGSGSSFFCMGNGKIPNNENFKIYLTQFVNRHKDSWF